jgi:hypothetical protein
MKRITVEFLKCHGACASQVKKFAKVFPKGASISLAAMRKAEQAGLNLWWLEQFIDAEYERQRAPLWAEYTRQEAPLWAEYKRQEAPLWAEYKRQAAPLWAEYKRQAAPLLIAALLRHKEVGK